MNMDDEVICLSSDDDESINQNKTNNRQSSVIKQTNDNQTSSIKVEDFTSKKESVETNGKKRKISEANFENNASFESSVKVLIREKDIVTEKNATPKKDATSTKDTTKNSNNLPTIQKNKILSSDKDKTSLKPQLVVKEIKPISLEEQDIFPMFISLCLQKDRSEDMKTIVNKLKRRYEQLDLTYANSETFISLLNEKRNEIMITKNKLYIHIAEVMNEMKKNRKNTSTLSTNGANSSAKTLCSNKSHTNNSSVSNSEEILIADDEKEKNYTQKKIRMILKAMKMCEKHIRKLEESEVDFDHENNSNYIKLEKFKHRMVELYNKYCEYAGENADAGRQYLRPKHFSTTGIVSVDQAITSFINFKICKRNKLKKIGAFTDALIFPDYRDILKCVTKCNEMHNLGLDNKKQHTIAKKAFTELGEYLQRSRRNDYWDTFSLFLENTDDDPASKDAELAAKLAQNKQEGEKKLANIFQEYVKKQDEMKNEPSETDTSSENEEHEEDCIEDEDADTNNEICNISEDGISLNTDSNKASTDEDENDEDGCEISVSKMDINSKPSVNDVQSDAIEIEKKQQTETNNKLKDGVSNNDVKSKRADTDVNTSKSEHTQLTKKNETVSSADTVLRDLNTSSGVVSLIKLPMSDTKIPIEKAKEDDSNIISEKLINEPASEEEEKPLLRVRSFAKLPGTWKDIQDKVGHRDKNSDLIDLTQDSQKQKSTAHQQASIKSKSKVSPVTKDKRKVLVIPAGKNIIKVKNVTNNYVRMGSKSSVDLNNRENLQRDIVTSTYQVVGNSSGSTTISLPPNQNFKKKTNDNDQVDGSETEKNIIVKVPQAAQIVFLLSKQKEKNTQQLKTNVSVSQSK